MNKLPVCVAIVPRQEDLFLHLLPAWPRFFRAHGLLYHRHLGQMHAPLERLQVVLGMHQERLVKHAIGHLIHLVFVGRLWLHFVPKTLAIQFIGYSI